MLSVVSVVELFPLWELQLDASRPMCPSLSLSAESFPLEWASVSSECVGWDTVKMSSPGQTDWLSVILEEALLWVSPSYLCVVPFPVWVPQVSGVWKLSLLIMKQNNYIYITSVLCICKGASDTAGNGNSLVILKICCAKTRVLLRNFSSSDCPGCICLKGLKVANNLMGNNNNNKNRISNRCTPGDMKRHETFQSAHRV